MCESNKSVSFRLAATRVQVAANRTAASDGFCFNNVLALSTALEESPDLSSA